VERTLGPETASLQIVNELRAPKSSSSHGVLGNLATEEGKAEAEGSEGIGVGNDGL
jgi:hypothetical protein